MDQKELRQLIAQAAAEKWTELDLSSWELTELAPEIGQLTNLTHLYLNNNELEELPANIGQLTNLTMLDLSENHIKVVPPEIGKLTNLASLYLWSNQLSTIPTEIGQLTNLTELALSQNLLMAIPVEVCQLTKLTLLYLNENELTILPADINRLTNLNELRLDHNQLTTIPPQIGQLTELDFLYLDNNQLTSLPTEIGQLTNLTSLDLSGNLLTSIPSEIGQLTNLETFKLGDILSGNQLSSLPTEISKLTSLTSLHLSHNLLTDVTPEIGRLTRLNSLYLSYNRLTAIPIEIKHLIQLQVLDLRNNHITDIPQVIGQLTNLTKFDLEHNQIKNLPNTLNALKKLEHFDLRGNPVQGISKEILLQYKNPSLILTTYFGQHQILHEAKLLLVGQGGVGKTALARRLLYNLSPDNEQGKTPGIDIHKWDFPQDEGYPITLNLWDFGGQGVYQATHQFFFTTRSLYLIVINARTGEQESRLRHWLKLVASLSNNAPVIIVVNKQDEQALALDERELKHKYPNLLHVIPTSCTTGMGIDELRQTIAEALTHLPGINDSFPTAWFDLKKQLEAMDANYITYERYAEYCQEAGIDTPADQRSWVQVLHQLGVILNYQDDNYRQLQGTHVLKPEWVTDGVYRILSDPDGKIAASNGILRAAMLDDILDPDTYPHHQQSFIVEMMRKFELSFRIPHQPDQYLIPDLLPKEQPSTADTFAEGTSLQFQIHYTDFLPSSILSRFMVGMMASLDRQASWRNGAVLNFDGNNALVRADLDARKLFITINGNESTRRGLLNSIRMQLHAIHNTFPNLPLTEHIPIPSHPDITIDYQDLLWYESEGMLSPPYAPIRGNIDVKALLDGIETSTMRRERKLQEALDKAYNLEELQQLCFKLKDVVKDLDYENLPGDTKSAKTRELVQFMGRRNQLDTLEAQLRERPY